MNVPSLSTIPKALSDALARLLGGVSYVTAGLVPTAHGAGSMQVDVALGTGLVNGVSFAYAGGNVVPAGGGANPRYDIVVIANGAIVPSVIAGAAAAAPVPPALGVGDLFLGLVFISANAIDYTTGGFVADYTMPLNIGGGSAAPNLVLNSDFGRRTVFGLAMPEVFADTAAWTGGAPAAAGNVLTIATASTHCVHGAALFWRDGRFSAQFQATLAGGRWILVLAAVTGPNIDALYVQQFAGNFRLTKIVTGVGTDLGTVANVVTLNNWYWLEIERQGTTYIGKIYSSGAAPGAKSAAALVLTFSGPAADATLAGPMTLGLFSDQANSKWGSQAASPGGVYVETWLPESNTTNWVATLGGGAVGYDEAADAGPIGKQFAIRAFIPATTRKLGFNDSVKQVQVAPSTAYTLSAYVKTNGYGGAGALIEFDVDWYDNAGAYISTTKVTDAAEVAWTRKTVTAASPANARYASFGFIVNPASTATGTVWLSCMQLEQGSAATAWRNAPADDGPIVWTLTSANAITTTSGAFISADDRDLAANVFLPWDATLAIEGSLTWTNSVGGNSNLANVQVDAASLDAVGQVLSDVLAAAAGYQTASFRRNKGFSAGKHRVVLQIARNAGTFTLGGNVATTAFTITATRGK